MMLVMRTTVNIDDDVLERAKDLAHRGRISVGEVLSAAARRGLEIRGELHIDPESGLPVIHAPGATALTIDEVNELRDDDFERYQDLLKSL